MLVDSFGRKHNYLRLAVTDRCNLRCHYCMPKQGLDWLTRDELMSHDEMLRICSLLVEMGVKKIRITGGEPFARKNIITLMQDLSALDGLETLTLTTNGVLTARYVEQMKEMGINSLNLSLDTLDHERFEQITHRDKFDEVLNTLHKLLEYNIRVKINTVVMEDVNISDLIPLVELTKKLPVNVRFIEEMPFNGGTHEATLNWDYKRILEHIKEQFPNLTKIDDAPHSTSLNYTIPGHEGTIGVIAAHSRLFCGSCNRIRLTPKGTLKTCLYGTGKTNLKQVLRQDGSDKDLENEIIDAIQQKDKDGWEAERNANKDVSTRESMATIGG